MGEIIRYMNRAKEKFIKLMVERNRIQENSKYGQFIIQTNEVQFYLTYIIFSRVLVPTKIFIKYLQGLTLGSLINYFRMCLRNSFELGLADSLGEYNKDRNTLAHKMFSNKKLTPKECELSIVLGDKLLKALIKLFTDEVKKSKFADFH